MLLRVPVVFLSGCFGILLQFYTLHVEQQLEQNPGYQAACDFTDETTQVPILSLFSFLKGSSCSKVFQSSYARLLSHFGLVERHGKYDFTLPYFGLVYFILVLTFPAGRKWKKIAAFDFVPSPIDLYYYLGIASLLFTVYLASVLKFVLQEFCIVCFATYCLNVICFVCFYLERRACERQKTSAVLTGTGSRTKAE
ncbi:unnamed protein product [Amoebophrya sp. A120]|nr:unnamed protein product [Amoebophrya sp. A120]|eukprot:GSA120T00024722001.1